MKFLWTTVYVKNLEESIAFYSDILGLQVTKRFPAGPGVEIAFMGNGTPGETLIELLADSTHSNINFTECLSIGFAVESLDAIRVLLNSKNIPVDSEVIETPGSKFFFISDPNGLIIQFFQQK